jgi:hypothetical protein
VPTVDCGSFQLREQDDVSTRAFGVDSDGKAHLINFSSPDWTRSEDIGTIAVVRAYENQVDAWFVLNSASGPFSPTLQL